MGTSTKLNGTVRAFIEDQHMFFVATAAPDGRVNLSPKGMDSLRIIDDNKIVWLNLTGSGNETAAHLLEHPRMTLMFCAFEGDARILRTYGSARAIHPGDDEWNEHSSMFDPMDGTRQIFILDIDMVQLSCGSGVPFMSYEGQRGLDELVPHWTSVGEEGVREYWQRKNSVSLDGKPTGI